MKKEDCELKNKKNSNIISLMLIIAGLFVSILAIMVFPSESSWGSVYSVLGILVFTIGTYKIMSGFESLKRFFLAFFVFIGTLAILIIADYVSVEAYSMPPRYRIKTVYYNDVLYHDAIFYDAIACKSESGNYVFDVVKNKNYTLEELDDYCWGKN